MAGAIRAEDAPSNTPAPDPPTLPVSIQPEARPQTAAIDKRVFGVLPNYRTAQETGIYEPITARRKLTIAAKDTSDAPLFVLGGAFALLAQMADQHPDFGAGAKGFARRWVTAYADQAISTYLTEGVLPVLFHEDPRYFRRGKEAGGSMKRRIGYAVSRIFVTKTDAGRTTVNYAELTGNAIAAGIGNAYYPQERGVADNVQRWGTAMGTDAISQILREIWPDVKHKYFSHHRD